MNGHAQPAVQFDANKFPATGHGNEAVTDQAGRLLRRPCDRRPMQNFNRFNAAAGKATGKASDNSFDFRKFRHLEMMKYER
jgi:hypothetical protein